jgi:hypothetical protein
MSEGAASSTISARVKAANIRNAKDIRKEKSCDATYKTEWRRFTTFVDAEVEKGELSLDDGIYLTRENVDIYFAESISARDTVTADTARRAVPALQWYADHVEHIHEHFVVEDSSAVFLGLEAQRERHAALTSQQYRDPHAKLPTDVLSPPEYVQLHIGSINHHSWADAQPSMATCDATYVRMSSYLKFTLADLKYDAAHGPNVRKDPSLLGPGGTGMLSLVL